MKRFESAVAVWPSSILTLTAWGDALHSQFVETGNFVYVPSL